MLGWGKLPCIPGDGARMGKAQSPAPNPEIRLPVPRDLRAGDANGYFIGFYLFIPFSWRGYLG